MGYVLIGMIFVPLVLGLTAMIGGDVIKDFQRGDVSSGIFGLGVIGFAIGVCITAVWLIGAAADKTL